MSWFEDALKLAAGKLLVMEQVDQATADFRWATCWTCENMNHESKRCKLCGCFLESKIWAKVSRAPHRPLGEITHCPAGKWNDMEITNHYRKLDGHDPLPDPEPLPQIVPPSPPES